MSIKDGYSICLNEWALDKDIKSELGLLLIISSLSASEGFCFAKNSYFAELFNLDEVSISRKIKKLEEKKYIKIKYEYRGNEVTKREIRLTKMLTDGKQKCYSTVNKNVKENNTINKNKIIKEEKPTKEQLKDYCSIQGLVGVNIDDFYTYYDAADWWDDLRNRPINWKQKLVSWKMNKKAEPARKSDSDDAEKTKERIKQDILKVRQKDNPNVKDLDITFDDDLKPIRILEIW